MTVLLFAETPRFSNEGHRFLVPVGESPPESVLADFARAAIEGGPGANYLAATRRATQVLENGTVRVGSELLVLAGLDVARLTLAQILAVQTWLYSKLESLSDGGPGKPTTRLVIERPILNELLGDPVFEQLATADWAHGPRALLDRQRGITTASGSRRARVLGLIASHAALLFLGGIAARRWFPPSQPAVPPTSPTNVGRYEVPALPGEAVNGAFSGAPTTAAGLPHPIGSPTDEGYEKTKVEFEASAARLPDSLKSRILRAFPSSQLESPDSLRDQVYQALDQLNQERKFREAIGLVESATKLPWAKAWGERLTSSRKDAEQGIDSQDQDLYERIRNTTGDPMNRVPVIEEYLRSAPRRYMADNAMKYLHWLSTPPSLEILGVRPSEGQESSQRYRLTISVGGRALVLDQVPIASRLERKPERIRLGLLVDDPWYQLIRFEVPSWRLSSYSGEWKLSRNAPPDQELELTNPIREKATLSFRVPELDNVPTLPPWKKPDEASFPDRRDTAGR